MGFFVYFMLSDYQSIRSIPYRERENRIKWDTGAGYADEAGRTRNSPAKAIRTTFARNVQAGRKMKSRQLTRRKRYSISSVNHAFQKRTLRGWKC